MREMRARLNFAKNFTSLKQGGIRPKRSRRFLLWGYEAITPGAETRSTRNFSSCRQYPCADPAVLLQITFGGVHRGNNNPEVYLFLVPIKLKCELQVKATLICPIVYLVAARNSEFWPCLQLFRLVVIPIEPKSNLSYYLGASWLQL